MCFWQTQNSDFQMPPAQFLCRFAEQVPYAYAMSGPWQGGAEKRRAPRFQCPAQTAWLLEMPARSARGRKAFFAAFTSYATFLIPYSACITSGRLNK